MTLEEYNLLLEMRKATRRSHHIANALILSKLVVVLTDRKLYARALSSFLPVYSKLEELLKHHKDVPALSTVVAVTSTIPARAAAMQQVMMWDSTHARRPRSYALINNLQPYFSCVMQPLWSGTCSVLPVLHCQAIASRTLHSALSCCNCI